MKTGIIVYSQTGNTLKAAERLLEAMEKKGQEAVLLQVKASNEKPEMDLNRVILTERPAVDPFDRLVFAAPVWAFSLCGIMRAYLSGLPTLSGKKVSLFVTHAFPLPFMGGNRALRQMTALCQGKGGEVEAACVVSWARSRREGDIARMVEKLS